MVPKQLTIAQEERARRDLANIADSLGVTAHRRERFIEACVKLADISVSEVLTPEEADARFAKVLEMFAQQSAASDPPEGNDDD